MNRTTRGLLATAALALALSGSRAGACAIPVFRYALENWPGELHVVSIFHQGPLTAEQEPLGRALGCNDLVPVERRDVGGLTNASREAQSLWASCTGAVPPWVALQGPPARDEEAPRLIWHGPLTAGNVSLLVEAPDRREIARRLLDGETAVWLLFRSGDAARDAAARTVLTGALAVAKAELRLPHQVADEGEESYDQPLATNIALRLDFSVLELAPGDAAADLLRAMIEPMAGGLTLTLPYAAPVFGRGRALDILSGENLTADAVLDMCAFLTGPCSCMVKDLNPGRDLFLPVDWDGLIGGRLTVAEALPPLRVPGAMPIVATNAVAVGPIAPAGPAWFVRGVGLVFGLGVVVIVLWTVRVLRKGGGA